MGASVRPTSGPDPLEQLKAMKAQQALDPLEQLKAMRDARTTSTGDEAHGGVIPSALDAMTFGLSRKAIAAGQSFASTVPEMLKHPSQDFGPQASAAYHQNLAAEEAASQQYHEAHPVIDTAAQVVGGAANVAATGGLGAAGDAAQIGRLARYGRTAMTGARYGILNAAGHSDAMEQGRGLAGVVDDAGKGGAIGAAAGLVSIPVSALAGKAIGATPLPRMVAAGAGRLARMLPGAGDDMAETIGGTVGVRGQANAVIARRAAMDAEAAGAHAPLPRALSPLNRNLPRSMGEPMQGVQTTPVRTVTDLEMGGGEPITDMELPRTASVPAPAPVADILKHKPSPMALDQAGPNVEGLAEGIANRPGPGRAIVQKALTARSAAMRPAISGALEAGTGVPADEGMHPLQAALDARAEEAKALFGAARAETKGQSVASDTFNKIIRSPAGRKALEVATTRQGNMFAEGPSVPHGYTAEQWDAVKAAMTERGIPIPENVGSPTNPLPDPETLHFMKEHLATLAKLGTQDGEAGALSQSAKGALSVWGKVREELPEVWKRADDAYAARSRVIDMMNKGRQVYSTTTNPPGTPQKAMAKSLDGLDRKLATAPAEERQAVQTGAAMAAHGKLESAPLSTKSPGRIFARTAETQRQTAYAFPTDEHASAFQDVVGTWDKAQQQAERMTGNSRTALRGAESGSGDILPLSRLISGRPRGMIRTVVNKLDAEYQAGQKQAIDAEIAKILTSPDGSALVKAASAGNLRAQTELALRLASARGISAAATGR